LVGKVTGERFCCGPWMAPKKIPLKACWALVSSVIQKSPESIKKEWDLNVYVQNLFCEDKLIMI
jgi:hypothetical protein